MEHAAPQAATPAKARHSEAAAPRATFAAAPLPTVVKAGELSRPA